MSRPCRSALTLLEMMVAVTLLAVIMIGLLAMFNQTQKALHIANAQTDVFENARGAIQMIARDLAEMTAFGQTGVTNGFANPISSGITLPLPGGNQSLEFGETFWLARANDDW
ncbi:MAG: prepilin-type N-terminal cleavage/methylation domain-containing protein, partial [Akkermansiaceae bacterium]|nr:prepilin-type N-terminal cleavage/methylation domain-containing protein [Verrucomicrobiales bacterium]